MPYDNSLGAFHYGGRDPDDSFGTSMQHPDEAWQYGGGASPSRQPDGAPHYGGPDDGARTARRGYDEPYAQQHRDPYGRRDEDYLSQSDLEDSQNSAAWTQGRPESMSPTSQSPYGGAPEHQSYSPHQHSEPEPVQSWASPSAADLELWNGAAPAGEAWRGNHGWTSTVHEGDEEEDQEEERQAASRFEHHTDHAALKNSDNYSGHDSYDYDGRGDSYGNQVTPFVTATRAPAGTNVTSVSPSPAAHYLQIPDKPLKTADGIVEDDGAHQKGRRKQSMGEKCGKKCEQFRELCSRPPHYIAKCPALVAICWFVVFVAMATLGLILFPLNLETSFDSFSQADVNSSLMYDAFIAATREVAGRSERRLNDKLRDWGPTPEQALRSATGLDEDAVGRRLQATPAPSGALMMYRIYDFSVAYELKNKAAVEGLFQKKILRDIAGFEKKLRDLPQWQDLCNMVEPRHRRMCTPGISWVNYALPTQNVSTSTVVPQSFTPNGQGTEVLPLDAVYYIVRQRNLQDLFLPKNYTYSKIFGPQYLRTSYRFKVPCCTNLAPLAVRRSTVAAMDLKWDKLSDTLLDTLQSSFQSSTDAIRVWWEGTGFDTKEVLQVLWQDIRLAAGAVVFVLIYMAIHTRSALLTIAGFLVIPLSLPVSYFLYTIMSGSTTLGIINFLSVFIIIGLGADVVFVYCDMWKDSVFHRDSESARLAWTYSHAGTATLATTSTTALAFLANLASVLRQLREFGLFMGICVCMAWVLVSLIFVPLCLADEKMCKGHSCAAKTERRLSVAFGHWSYRLAIIRHPCCSIPVLLAILFIILSLIYAQIGTGTGELFPSNHNRNRGVEVFREFKAGDLVLPLRFLPPPEQEYVCNNNDFGPLPPGTPKTCVLHWCLVSSSAAITTTNSSCTCYVRRQLPCGQPGGNTVRIRLAGVAQVTAGDLTGAIFDYVRRPGIFPLKDFIQQGPTQSLLLQDWEAGNFVFTPVVEVTVPLSPLQCGWDDQCYCGQSICRDDIVGWTLQGRTVNLPGNNFAGRRLEGLQAAAVDPVPVDKGAVEAAPAAEDEEQPLFVETESEVPPEPPLTPEELEMLKDVRTSDEEHARRLQDEAEPVARRLQLLPQEQWTVATNRRVSVEVVYGLEIIPDPPLLKARDMANAWKFRDGFDFRQPWVQRHLYKMCTEFPPELRVVNVMCWIVDFYKFLLAKNPPERFPVVAGRFNALLSEFAESGTTGNGLSRHYMWIRNGQMLASFVSFQVDVDRYSGINKALDYKALWDKQVNRANFYGPYYIGQTGYRWAPWPMVGAFHVSSFWASAEAHSALVSSTVLTLTIVLLLAFLTMLLFTGDCCLSLLVVWATIEVISGLFFFMVFIMGWLIGPIEVLALIVFVGYALDYSLHVAQKYGSREALEQQLAPEVLASPYIQDARLRSRLQRVTHALKSIGGANLGSAITTTGCALFLIFCQLAIFKKLGIVVVVVTLLSILVAFTSLPAKLLIVGPLRPNNGCCCNSERMREFLSKWRHLLKHPNEIPGELKKLCCGGHLEEEHSLKEEARGLTDDDTNNKTWANSGASWRRRRLGLESCFDKDQGHDELSLGLQAARITADPILEVSRYQVEDKTVHARAVQALDPRPSTVPPTWQAMRALTMGAGNANSNV